MHYRGQGALLAALSLSACISPEDVPSPPSTQELLAIYVEPTGELSEVDVLAVVEEVTEEGPLGAFDNQTYVDEAIGAVSDVSAPNSGAVDLGRLRLSGEAVLQVTAPCQGDPKTAGQLVCEITFTPEGLNPSLWGTAKACILETGRGPLQFDGSFLISLDDVDGFTVNPNQWTARFEGTVEAGGTVIYSGAVDAQRRDERFVGRFPLQNNTWAFLGYDTTRPDELILTDTEGSYICDFGVRECTTMDHPGGNVQF